MTLVFRIFDFHRGLFCHCVIINKINSHAPSRIGREHPTELLKVQLFIVELDDQLTLVVILKVAS